MKQITVSDQAASQIEKLRDNKLRSYEGELERILDALSGLNNMMCFSKDSEDVAQFANDIHLAEDQILMYYDLLKNLVQVCDFREDGKVQVTQMED